MGDRERPMEKEGYERQRERWQWTRKEVRGDSGDWRRRKENSIYICVCVSGFNPSPDLLVIRFKKIDPTQPANLTQTNPNEQVGRVNPNRCPPLHTNT